jgi:hypothetical protein
MPSARPELNFITGPPYTQLDVDADGRLQKKVGGKTPIEIMVGHAPDTDLDFSEIQRMEARVKVLAAIGLGVSRIAANAKEPQRRRTLE